MPLDLPESFAALGGLLNIVRDFTKALGKASAGGRKITPGEWAVITADIREWVERTATDFVD